MQNSYTPACEVPIMDNPSAAIAKLAAAPTAATESLNLSQITPITGPVNIIMIESIDIIAVAFSSVNPLITIVGIPCCIIELDAITASVHDISTSHVIGFDERNGLDIGVTDLVERHLFDSLIKYFDGTCCVTFR